MKFLCENCKAKYQIADDKAAGRTVRMRCRKCGHLIEVQASVPGVSSTPGPMEEVDLQHDLRAAPAHPPRAAGGPPRPGQALAPGRLATSPGARPAPTRLGAPGAGPAGSGLAGAFSSAVVEAAGASPAVSTAAAVLSGGSTEEWYVGINGAPVGPVRLGELRRKAQNGFVNEDSLVWREGLEEWVPLRTYPELVALIQEAVASTRASLTPPPGALSSPPKASPGPLSTRGAAPALVPARAPAPKVTPAPVSRSNVVPLAPRATPGHTATGPTASVALRAPAATPAAPVPAATLAAPVPAAAPLATPGPVAPSTATSAVAPAAAPLGAAPTASAAAPAAALPAEPASSPLRAPPSSPQAAPLNLSFDNTMGEPSPLSAQSPDQANEAPSFLPAAISSEAPAASKGERGSDLLLSEPPRAARRVRKAKGGLPSAKLIAIVLASVLVGMILMMLVVAVPSKAPQPTSAGPTATTPTGSAPVAPAHMAAAVPAKAEPASEDTATSIGPIEVSVAPGGRQAGAGKGSSRSSESASGANPGATAASQPAPNNGSLSGLGSLVNGPSAAGPSGPAGGGGQLSEADVSRVVQSRRAFVSRRCWEPALAGHAPGTPGSAKVVAAVSIAPDGHVSDVGVSGGDGFPGLAPCIQTQVKTWSFPRNDGSQSIKIPFVFAAQ